MKTTIQGRFKTSYEGVLTLIIETSLEHDSMFEAVESWDEAAGRVKPSKTLIFDEGEILIVSVLGMDEATRLAKELHDHLEATDRKTKVDASASMPALIVSWTESEAGWGCRPDGYSLHRSQVDFLNVEGRTSHDTRVHKRFDIDIYGQYVIDWDGNVPDNLTRRLCVSGEYIKKLRGKK